MIPARYFVVKHNETWQVEFESVFWNGHRTQKEAIEAAIEAARKETKAGRPAEVLVQSESLLWFTVWSSRDQAGASAEG